MSKLTSIVIVMLISSAVYAQPGKYAGSMKKLLNKTYTDEKHISGLAGWTFQEGSMITEVNDPEVMTADVFKKGTTYVVLFSVKEDTADTKFTIVDVLEVKGVLSTQHIRTGTCQEGQSGGGLEIVALIKKENKEFSKAIKAWRLNRDKKRIELADARLVMCMNEGGD